MLKWENGEPEIVVFVPVAPTDQRWTRTFAACKIQTKDLNQLETVGIALVSSAPITAISD